MAAEKRLAVKNRIFYEIKFPASSLPRQREAAKRKFDRRKEKEVIHLIHNRLSRISTAAFFIKTKG